jgi:hypothetical protein
MSLGIYELLYQPGQKAILGPPFITLNTAEYNEPHLRELLAFEYFCREKLWERHYVSGLLSPQFTRKTGISPNEAELFIRERPKHDIYLFHPYPRELRIQNHFLELAELEHPGISDAIQYVWRTVLGRNRPILDLPSKQHFCCHCNYIAATPRFWSKYSLFVISFMELLRSEEGAFLRKSAPYTLTRTKDTELPIAVFVFERALSHFLCEGFRIWNIANYAYIKRGYLPPELFAGEEDLVNSLASNCVRRHKYSKDILNDKRSSATIAYYHFRRLWSSA